MIHAPLAMTRRKNGFLARSSGQQSLIIAELDNEKRRKAISKFDVLSQLNREFYRQMKMSAVNIEVLIEKWLNKKILPAIKHKKKKNFRGCQFGKHSGFLCSKADSPDK